MTRRELRRRRRIADALGLVLGALWGGVGLMSVYVLAKQLWSFEVWLMVVVAAVVVSWWPLWWVLENNTVDTTEPRFGWGGEIR